MAVEVVVPRLGWSMDEGTFGEWLKQDGEYVAQGQSLFVLEGEKSAQEIESFDAGILRIPPHGPRSGDLVKVGQVLAYLVAENETPPFALAGAAVTTPTVEPASPAKVSATPSEPAVSVPVTPATVASPAVQASPRARRKAAELGIDWTNLTGSGSTGRIRERDVLAAAQHPTATTGRGVVPASRKGGQPQPVTRLRKAIATRMLAGANETAPVTLTMPCDATNLVSLRQQFRTMRRDAEDVVPDYNDLIIKLTAAVLERHPLLAARWGEQEITLPSDWHIAMAVDTEGGLLAPVIRHVDRMSLRQLATETRRLAHAARAGTLPEGDLQGGVFTITNLGMFGVTAFTPVINLPQASILGVGAIVREPAVSEDKIVIRDRVTLSLTFDHRVVDGAPAARFLAELRLAIEQPGPWLMS
ncbi:MAG: 2-oxo acid dehydrogenase subunit E2 [Planctomycetes bacterium]|nr:2-oxo acid dehydrogenase subunit E2 [Planctomycetota bacterium]